MHGNKAGYSKLLKKISESRVRLKRAKAGNVSGKQEGVSSKEVSNILLSSVLFHASAIQPAIRATDARPRRRIESPQRVQSERRNNLTSKNRSDRFLVGELPLYLHGSKTPVRPKVRPRSAGVRSSRQIHRKLVSDAQNVKNSSLLYALNAYNSTMSARTANRTSPKRAVKSQLKRPHTAGASTKVGAKMSPVFGKHTFVRFQSELGSRLHERLQRRQLQHMETKIPLRGMLRRKQTAVASLYNLSIFQAMCDASIAIRSCDTNKLVGIFQESENHIYKESEMQSTSRELTPAETKLLHGMERCLEREIPMSKLVCFGVLELLDLGDFRDIHAVPLILLLLKRCQVKMGDFQEWLFRKYSLSSKERLTLSASFGRSCMEAARASIHLTKVSRGERIRTNLRAVRRVTSLF